MSNDLTISATFLPATPSGSDPLAQRAHLAVKMSGGLHIIVTDGSGSTAVEELRDTVSRHCEAALREALLQPKTTIAKTVGA